MTPAGSDGPVACIPAASPPGKCGQQRLSLPGHRGPELRKKGWAVLGEGGGSSPIRHLLCTSFAVRAVGGVWLAKTHVRKPSLLVRRWGDIGSSPRARSPLSPSEGDMELRLPSGGGVRQGGPPAGVRGESASSHGRGRRIRHSLAWVGGRPGPLPLALPSGLRGFPAGDPCLSEGRLPPAPPQPLPGERRGLGPQREPPTVPTCAPCLVSPGLSPALITKAPSAWASAQLGSSQKLRPSPARACCIPAHRPQPAVLPGAAAAGWGAWMRPNCAPGCPAVSPPPAAVLSPNPAKSDMDFSGPLGLPGGAECPGARERKAPPHERNHLTLQCRLLPCGSQPSLEPQQGPWALGDPASLVWDTLFRGDK